MFSANSKLKSMLKRTSKKTCIRLTALVMMAVMCVSSTLSVAAFSRKVLVKDGDQVIQVTTMSVEMDKILQAAGITLEPGDKAEWIDRSPEMLQIEIKRSFPVYLEADGIVRKIYMTEGSVVADAVSQSGVVYNRTDAVSPTVLTALTPDMHIQVQRRYNVTVQVDGETKSLVAGGLLETVLQEAGIVLGEFDVVSADLQAPVFEGMAVTIDRVEYRETTRTEEIPYETQTDYTSALMVGETEVQTAGVAGERSIVVREKLVNGEVVETEELSNEVVKNPVDEVLLAGTTPKPIGYATVSSNGTLIDHNGNQVSYLKKLTGSCTAYTAPAGSGTATGAPARFGNVAVNPNIIPYGTKLYICSPDGSFVYGYATAVDTGGALMNGLGLVDLFYSSLSECYAFGRRTMDVYILS